MEEEEKNRLIDKIIKEQDLVSIYTYNHFNKSLGIMQKYSGKLNYSNIKEFIIDNPIIIDNLSIKNLYTLLATMGKDKKDEDAKKRIIEKIAEKVKDEEFFCEDLDSDVFLDPIHTANAFGRIEESLRQEIRRKNKRRFTTVKRNRI